MIINSLLEGRNKNEKLLKLFSAYIASNPDFKYNKTYLTDNIVDFLKDYKIIESKLIIYKEILNFLLKKINKHISVVFDDTFTNNGIDDNLLLLQDNVFCSHKICTKGSTIKLIQEKPHMVEYYFEIENIYDNSEWKSKVNYFIDRLKIRDNEEK